MDTDDILYDFAFRNGWPEPTQIALLTEYIDNQDGQEAFREFLRCVEEDGLHNSDETAPPGP